MASKEPGKPTEIPAGSYVFFELGVAKPRSDDLKLGIIDVPDGSIVITPEEFAQMSADRRKVVQGLEAIGRCWKTTKEYVMADAEELEQLLPDGAPGEEN